MNISTPHLPPELTEKIGMFSLHFMVGYINRFLRCNPSPVIDFLETSNYAYPRSALDIALPDTMEVHELNTLKGTDLAVEPEGLGEGSNGQTSSHRNESENAYSTERTQVKVRELAPHPRRHMYLLD